MIPDKPHDGSEELAKRGEGAAVGDHGTWEINAPRGWQFLGMSHCEHRRLVACLLLERHQSQHVGFRASGREVEFIDVKDFHNTQLYHKVLQLSTVLSFDT